MPARAGIKRKADILVAGFGCEGDASTFFFLCGGGGGKDAEGGEDDGAKSAGTAD